MLHLPPCRAVVAAVEASWNFQVAMPVLVQKLLELLSSLSNFSYFTQDLCFNKWLKVGGRQTLTESFSSNKKQELMYVTNYKGHLLDSRSIHFFVAKNFVLQCNILEFQLVCSFHIRQSLLDTIGNEVFFYTYHQKGFIFPTTSSVFFMDGN